MVLLLMIKGKGNWYGDGAGKGKNTKKTRKISAGIEIYQNKNNFYRIKKNITNNMPTLLV